MRILCRTVCVFFAFYLHHTTSTKSCKSCSLACYDAEIFMNKCDDYDDDDDFSDWFRAVDVPSVFELYINRIVSYRT